jgi:hypothetical protein
MYTQTMSKPKQFVRKNFYVDPDHFEVMDSFAKKRNIKTSTVLRLIMKKFVNSLSETEDVKSTAD